MTFIMALSFLVAAPRQASAVATITPRAAILAFRGGLGSGTAPVSMAASSFPDIKLYYFDVPFWRAEVVRLALYVGGVPFEDVRDQKSADLKAQGKLTFGAMPVLEVDGQILSQTQAMAVYAAKLAGIQPDDAWAAAKVDEAINGCTDVTTTLGATFRLPDDEKAAARAALVAVDGRLAMHLGGLEKICSENGENGHMVGETLTVADFAVRATRIGRV